MNICSLRARAKTQEEWEEFRRIQGGDLKLNSLQKSGDRRTFK